MKKQNSIVAILLLVVVILVGYILVQHSSQKESSLEQSFYVSKEYGYEVAINPSYTYKEFNNNSPVGSGTGLFVSDPKATDVHYGLTINVLPLDIGGQTMNPTTLNGLPVTSLVSSEDGISRQTYHVVSGNKIYEITYAPSDSKDFEAITQSFKFTN